MFVTATSTEFAVADEAVLVYTVTEHDFESSS